MKTLVTFLSMVFCVSLAFASGEVPWPKPVDPKEDTQQTGVKTTSVGKAVAFDVGTVDTEITDTEITTLWSGKQIRGFYEDGFFYSYDKYERRECAQSKKPCPVDNEDLVGRQICYRGPVHGACAALQAEFQKNYEAYIRGAHALNELVSCDVVVDAGHVKLSYTMITDYDDATLLAERELEACPSK